jgi:SAM-dependent methyltransferase
MNCGARELQRFLDLGEQPNGNRYPSREELHDEPRFPFAMLVCKRCWQVQLEEFPPMEFLFGDHPYVTGVNRPVVEHFARLAERTLAEFSIPARSLVIDIGCNDGTLLRTFEQRGLRGLGVDPGRRTGELCRQQGTSVCETFWNHATGRAVRQLNLKPALISATAVFYHVQDIHDFVRGLVEVMDENALFLAQCVSLKDVLEKCQFDHFYHEHTLIHSVAALRGLFEQHGMRILDVHHYDVHGGSFVVYAGLARNPRPTTKAVDEAVQAEVDAGLMELATYERFAQRVAQNRTALVELLRERKRQGRRVWALGAPLKGSTLLNYCGIGPELVERAVEVNPFKIGRVTPGTHIPIVDERAQTEQPDDYLVLAWNFLDHFLVEQRAFLEGGGCFLVPNPTVRVLSKEALGPRR